MYQTIFNDYPPALTAGTNMFFANTKVRERQHVAGVKSPLLQIFDSQRAVSNGSLEIISTTVHQTLSELEFRKLITSNLEELETELLTVIGQKVPFVGTGRVALTLKFEKN